MIRQILQQFRQHRLQSVIIVVGVILAGVGVSLYVAKLRHKDAPKVVYSAEDNVPPQEQLFSIPKGSTSRVCQAASAEEVAAITKQKVTGAMVSIPTKTTPAGQVSACIYPSTKPPTTNISHVGITSRVFASKEAAEKAFATLTTHPAKGSKMIDDQNLFNQDASQLVTLDGDVLSTINIVRINSTKTVGYKLYSALAGLL